MTLNTELLDAARNPHWLDACFASLCNAYKRADLIFGVPPAEQCRHLWCQGIVDVLGRIYGHALDSVEARA